MWDTIGFILVLHDIITIPMDVAWDREKSSTEEALFRIMIAFWTTDIALTFNTGFYLDGQIQMSRCAAAKHYARGWLAFDSLIVILDWIFLLVPQGAMMSIFRSARAVRLLRMLRVLRILKMGRLSHVLEDICFHYDQGWLVLSSAIVKALVTIVLVAHVCACAWYLLGRLNEDRGERSWIGPIRDNSPFLLEDTDGSYSLALQWVLGYLTGASVDGTIAPQNTLERVFVMFIIVGSLLILGTAISKISQTIYELNKLESDHAETKIGASALLQSHGYIS